ncbi:MAG: glycosyltransferase [Bacteroides sp.]|nr:glycosyltransferase [Bacteroides sp.]
MKVLYILSGPSIYDGSSKSFLNLIRGLRKENNIEIFVVCPSRKGMYELLVKEGFNAVGLKYAFSTKPDFSSIKSKLYFIPKLLRRFLFNNFSQCVLYLYCKKYKPDIIHTNTTAVSIGYFVAKKLGIPHIWHIREYGDLDFGMNMRKINSYLINVNNYTISITEDIAKHRGVYRKQGNVVIYNGIYNTEDAIYIEKKDNYYLYAGRIQETKGLKELVQAFILFLKSRPNSEIVLKIAEGAVDRPYKDEIIELIKDSNIGNKIEWLGHISDIGALMSKAMAIIVPSYNEGFGRVTAEAMFNGALVVGRNTGGTKEQFDNGEKKCGQNIGLRFTTTEECSQCLISIYDKGINAFNEMILKGQQTAVSLYSNEAYVKNVSNFYSKVLSNQ